MFKLICNAQFGYIETTETALKFLNSAQFDSAKIVIYEYLESKEDIPDSQFVFLNLRLADIGLKTGDNDFLRKCISAASNRIRLMPLLTDMDFVFTLANYHIVVNQYDSAKILLNKVYKKAKKKKYRKNSLINLSNIYYYENNLDSSRHYLQRLNKEFGLQSSSDSAFYFNLKAAQFFDEKEYDSAEIALNKILLSYNRRNKLSDLAEVYFNLAKIARLKNSTINTFDYLVRMDSVKEIIAKNNSERIAQEAEAKYHLREKEIEALNERVRADKNEQKAKSRSVIIWVLVISILIILPLLLWFSYSVRTIRIKNEALKLAQSQLESVNERLEQRVNDRTIELEERNKRLERYAFATSHKLRKPLANILGLITLFADNQGNDQLIDMLERSSEELDDAVRHMGEILDRKEGKSNQSS